MDFDLTPDACYFDRSLFGWAVKDCHSRYLYGNKLVCRYFNIDQQKLPGLRDIDLTPDIQQDYERICQDDSKILNTHNMSVALKTFDYGRRNSLRTFLVEKRFWQLPDGSDGIICTYMEIANLYFSTFLMPYTRRSFVFTRPADIFTDKEWEIILLLQCGVKKSVMPGILGVSFSTLRNRLARCCDKTGMTNSAALLRYCSQQGWDNYIPPFFLQKGFVSIN